MPHHLTGQELSRATTTEQTLETRNPRKQCNYHPIPRTKEASAQSSQSEERASVEAPSNGRSLTNRPRDIIQAQVLYGQGCKNGQGGLSRSRTKVLSPSRIARLPTLTQVDSPTCSSRLIAANTWRTGARG